MLTDATENLINIVSMCLGETFKFTCGRWLGQNVDDGSTERYMVGYPALTPNSLERDLMSVGELPFSSQSPAQSSNSQDLFHLVEECSNNAPETTCPPMQLKVHYDADIRTYNAIAYTLNNKKYSSFYAIVLCKYFFSVNRS